MSSSQLVMPSHRNLSSNPEVLSYPSKELKELNKTHHYKVSNDPHNHVFVPKDGGIRAYMTEQGEGVEAGDYLVLQKGAICDRYQVDKINYYSSPPDMWIALLKQCPSQ